MIAGDVQQYMQKFNSEVHWPLGTPVEPLVYIISAVSSGSGDFTGASSAWKNWKLYSSANQCIIWVHYFHSCRDDGTVGLWNLFDLMTET